MRPRSATRKSTTMMHLNYLVFLLLLLLPESGTCLFEREVGTSFSSASVTGKGNKQIQMQVCITIGCCHHVCRQFLGDTSGDLLKQTALAPFTLQSTPQHSPGNEVEPDVNDSVALVPSVLEWSSRPVYFPSIKFLTIFNTGNTSWIKVSAPACTDEQFFVQEIGMTAIAPGESLTVPVVFLPRRPGPASGKIILETSAGKVTSQLRGEGLLSPYQLPELVGIEAVEGKPQKHRIRFHNPHEEAVEIDEVQVWPEDAYNKALCLSDETEDRITSCFADSFTKAALSRARNEKYASQGTIITLQKLDDWKIPSQETAELVELKTTVTATWSGLVYIKFSRNNAEEVAVIPLELNTGSENGEAYGKASQRSQAVLGSEEKIDDVPVSRSRWTHTSDLVALKVAETLLKDLAHKLLRQSDIKKGSLAGSQKDATLVPEELLSFPLVQKGLKQSMWIHLVNTGDEPVAVNLILSSEAKSRDCQYKANWLWQGQKPQIHRQNTVFSFESGAVTEAVLKRRSKLALGPLTFHPKQKCDWFGMLFIKNNVTGLEWIPVRGRGGSARMVFLDQGKAVRRLDMTVEDTPDSATACSRTVQKAFQVENTGELPLEVHDISLEKAPRISLKNTNGFTLAIGETTEMMVSYTPDFEKTEGKQMLRMSTSIGVVNIPVMPKLSRDLVDRCKSFPLHERIALPVSICALTLALGVFSWLLLQEVSAKRDISKRMLKWIRSLSITIARRFKAFKGTLQRRSKVKYEEGKHLKPVVTRSAFQPDLPEKTKLRRKKKSRNNSSPRSQSSSSGPPSPHSCSESETKAAPIERFFSSSRFSESPTKTKSRTSLAKKKMVVNEDVQDSWDVLNVPTTSQTTEKAAEENKSTSCFTTTPETTSASESFAAKTPEKVRTEALESVKLTKETGTTSCCSPVGHNRNQETSTKQQSQVFYDIWGDHFADVRGALSTPGSPSSIFDNSQSLFSQSLPRSKASIYSQNRDEVDDFCLPSPQDWFNVPDDILSSSEDLISAAENVRLQCLRDAFNAQKYLPNTETFGHSYFEWNSDHLYS